MVHELKTIARNHRFDVEDFLAFWAKREKEGAREVWLEGETLMTNTWWANTVISQYEASKR